MFLGQPCRQDLAILILAAHPTPPLPPSRPIRLVAHPFQPSHSPSIPMPFFSHSSISHPRPLTALHTPDCQLMCMQSLLHQHVCTDPPSYPHIPLKFHPLPRTPSAISLACVVFSLCNHGKQPHRRASRRLRAQRSTSGSLGRYPLSTNQNSDHPKARGVVSWSNFPSFKHGHSSGWRPVPSSLCYCTEYGVLSTSIPFDVAQLRLLLALVTTRFADDVGGPVVGWHRFPSPYQPLRHAHKCTMSVPDQTRTPGSF